MDSQDYFCNIFVQSAQTAEGDMRYSSFTLQRSLFSEQHLEVSVSVVMGRQLHASREKKTDAKKV